MPWKCTGKSDERFGRHINYERIWYTDTVYTFYLKLTSLWGQRSLFLEVLRNLYKTTDASGCKLVCQLVRSFVRNVLMLIQNYILWLDLGKFMEVFLLPNHMTRWIYPMMSPSMNWMIYSMFPSTKTIYHYSKNPLIRNPFLKISLFCFL